MNNLFFPVLGNISSRVKWRNKIKRKIRKTFKTRELFYLELDKICFSKTNGAINKNIDYDKHHIAQDKIIYEYQKKINNQSY